jgi:hypothetical protein
VKIAHREGLLEENKIYKYAIKVEPEISDSAEKLLGELVQKCKK